MRYSEDIVCYCVCCEVNEKAVDGCAVVLRHIHTVSPL